MLKDGYVFRYENLVLLVKTSEVCIVTRMFVYVDKASKLGEWVFEGWYKTVNNKY